MKKLLSLALMAVLSLTLVACSGGEQNSDEKEYIIYSDNSFAPFEFLDTQTNEYVGIDMDLLAAIAEDQGFKYVVKNEGFDASMGAVQSGQADAMIAGMSITDERKLTYDFSDGYFTCGQVIAVREDSNINSLEDLRGKTVAAKISTAGADYAESIKDEYDLEIVHYEDSPTMYTAVENGTNVACFEDAPVIKYAILSENKPFVLIGDEVNATEYGFAVKKDTNPELIEMFNKGLENIKANGKYNEILAKYGN